MTLPREVFQTKKAKCPGCGESFKEKLIKAGRPATYCRRCRKDQMIYPGATRRQRHRVKHQDWDAGAARKQARAEISERLLGVPDSGEES